MQRRISFFITEYHNEILNELIKGDVKTQAKIIRKGIELYKQTHDAIKNGGRVEITDVNGNKSTITL